MENRFEKNDKDVDEVIKKTFPKCLFAVFLAVFYALSAILGV